MKKQMINKPKRSSVAKLAGVSETTVSRVFNTPELVSPQKVEQVLAVARKMGYYPDKNASALRRKGTGNLLFMEIVKPAEYDWTKINYYNWFYANIIRTLFSVMEENMYQFRHYKAQSNYQILALKEKNICDGILAFNIDNIKTVNALRSLNIPFICCHHTENLSNCNTCSTDNFNGGFLAAQHLYERHHRKPVYITGYLKNTFAHQQRTRGFLKGFQDTKVQILDTEADIDGGYKAGVKIAHQIKNRQIDCIGVVNDLTAIGVIHALMKNNIRIPNDVSIIGYDNLPFTISLPFRLTTIDLLLEKIYHNAVELLIQSIKTGKFYREKTRPVLINGDSVLSR